MLPAAPFTDDAAATLYRFEWHQHHRGIPVLNGGSLIVQIDRSTLEPVGYQVTQPNPDHAFSPVVASLTPREAGERFRAAVRPVLVYQPVPRRYGGSTPPDMRLVYQFEDAHILIDAATGEVDGWPNRGLWSGTYIPVPPTDAAPPKVPMDEAAAQALIGDLMPEERGRLSASTAWARSTYRGSAP